MQEKPGLSELCTMEEPLAVKEEIQKSIPEIAAKRWKHSSSNL